MKNKKLTCFNWMYGSVQTNMYLWRISWRAFRSRYWSTFWQYTHCFAI